jgi:uncharacterized protein (TIGR00251 family)
VTLSVGSSARGATFAVRVVPRAGRTAVAGVRHDALLVRLAAPPVDGAANDALVALLASLLGCARRDIAIVSGQSARDKRVAVQGMTAEALRARLDAILAADTP